jgi:hypothetical protein
MSLFCCFKVSRNNDRQLDVVPSPVRRVDPVELNRREASKKVFEIAQQWVHKGEQANYSSRRNVIDYILIAANGQSSEMDFSHLIHDDSSQRTEELLRNIFNFNSDSILKYCHYKKKLTVLNLSNNRIVHLPESVGQLVNLSILILENNELASLPNELENLKNLKTLNVSKNRFIFVPEVIKKIGSLEVLLLNENRSLEEFPDRFIWSLPKLTELDLSRTALKSLPGSIGNLSRLKYIHVFSTSNLIHLPLNLANCRQLTQINISYNALQDKDGVRILAVKRFGTLFTRAVEDALEKAEANENCTLDVRYQTSSETLDNRVISNEIFQKNLTELTLNGSMIYDSGLMGKITGLKKLKKISFFG